MPQKQQAIKALRQSKKREAKNKILKSTVKTLVKKTRKSIDNKAKDIDAQIKQAQKLLDKAIKQGIMKKNTVARRKSRLMKKLNKQKTSK
ncbi:30S ribosomal protein S20 [Candidatus Falkowbacteria bacterium RIFOXYD2_FULL_35_9]|uniref:Small ribosomal subunit protein bS20 n=1 Tax=Candidatus Falkowbacteria bacterium RIFOXYC2_FULL_36_12 TaxID=1798002 RepID=A0A1F5T3N5_9BACT|nr:MAG: 30S ribosomal protein S20 [Candidatus Falkowbacteria bacterium RIFOXYB2_FULL_35_7]OGF33509.1 MAG: 30S ribosomal protein S20 [Candidatus Falkowbacteria bacterium RIFOXYC2_FULL_36_12]OGF47776.1 MAG: 30S ribosomal protein S20 [Candidatus Falkowbacteria bacterium RIFOXYD2_FULL_35_9]